MSDSNLSLYVEEELSEGYYILKKDIAERIVEELISNFEFSYNSSYDELNYSGGLYITKQKLSEMFGNVNDDDLYSIQESLQEDHYDLVNENVGYDVDNAKPPGITWVSHSFNISVKNNKIFIEIEIDSFDFDADEEKAYYLDI